MGCKREAERQWRDVGYAPARVSIVVENVAVEYPAMRSFWARSIPRKAVAPAVGVVEEEPEFAGGCCIPHKVVLPLAASVARKRGPGTSGGRERRTSALWV